MEVNPLTYKIDNDCAVSTNVLGGVTATCSDSNAVTSSAQAAFSAVAQPFVDAVTALNTALSPTPAASCGANAANQLADAAVNGILRMSDSYCILL